MISPDEPQEPVMTTDDQIGQLLRLAGRRPMPDPGDMRRARAAAHAEWALVVQQRARKGRWRSLIGGAIAAAACAAAAWTWMRPPTPPVASSEVATIQRVTGTIIITSAHSESRPVRDAGVQVEGGGSHRGAGRKPRGVRADAGNRGQARSRNRGGPRSS